MTRKDVFIAIFALYLLTTVVVKAGNIFERSKYTTTEESCEELNNGIWRDIQSLDECVEAHNALFGGDPTNANDNSDTAVSEPCGCTDHSHGTVDFWGIPENGSKCSATAPCTGFRDEPGQGDLACFCKRIGDDSPSPPTPMTVMPTESPISPSEYRTTTDTCESIDGYPPDTWRDLQGIDECIEAYKALLNQDPNGIYDSGNPGQSWAPCGCTYHEFGDVQFWGLENKNGGESGCDTRVKCTNFRGDGDLGCLCKRNIPFGGTNFPSTSFAPTKSPTESVPLCLQKCSSTSSITDEECKGPTDIPRFLFAGQSNMVGWSDENYEGLFTELVTILKQKEWSKNQKLTKMEEVINQTTESDPQASANEAKFLYKIRKYMKRKKFIKNYKKVVCSSTDPSRLTNELDCERPISPTACGGSGNQYGPELMFAHQFPKLKSPYKGRKIGIIKVAEGGTRIYNNWMKEMDGIGKNHWSLLSNAIHAAKGTIEAFIWFQGENDSFGTWDTENYLDNLQTFVADVRTEIFDASKNNGSTRFDSPSDIPVVIVELGCWIYCDGNTGVTEAQRSFVESDKNAMLVETGGSDDDNEKMAKFYHYDSAALLIIGSRIAKILAKLLKKQLNRAYSDKHTFQLTFSRVSF